MPMATAAKGCESYLTCQFCTLLPTFAQEFYYPDLSGGGGGGGGYEQNGQAGYGGASGGYGNYQRQNAQGPAGF